MKKVRLIKRYALLSICLSLCMCIFPGCEKNPGEAHSTIFAMDTYMDVTLYGENAKECLTAVESKIQTLDHMLDATDEESEIYRINREKSGVFSEDTARIWEGALETYEKTEGKLDLTVYPLVKAWGFDTKEYAVPSEEVLEECLQNIGMDLVDYNKDNKEVVLPEGTELDFGAVAKGYTGQVIADYLKKQGVKSALLYLGGNVQLVGGKPDGTDYRIGIKNPEDDKNPIGVLSVSDVAVVTSGGYERYFEKDGKVYHHILDPRTGYPADTDLVSVTIVSKDGLLADAYSTALYVYGLEDAISFWKEYGDTFQAVFYDKQGKVYVTEGLADFFSTKKEMTVITLE